MKTTRTPTVPISMLMAGLLWVLMPAGRLSAAGPAGTILLEPQGLVEHTRRPEFSWEAVAGADQHYVWLARNGAAYQALWVGTTTWTPGEDLPGGSYRWWVLTYGAGEKGPWSASAAFSIPVAIPGKVLLLGPSGSASSSQPTFSWEPDDAATEYHLWSRRNGVFAFQAHISAPTLAYTPGSRLPDGQYDWWLRASGPDGAGPWSGPLSFRLGRPLEPGSVDPLAPSGTTTDAFPRFEWTGVSNAESYYLWITRGGKKHQDVQVEEDTEWVPETQFPPGSYTWWVRAENPSANGPWSAAGSFSLGYPTAPVTEQLYPDWEDSEYSSQPFFMMWRGDEYATWVRIQVMVNDRVVVDTWENLADEDSVVLRLPDRCFLYLNLLLGEWWRVQHYRPGQGVGAWSDGSGYYVHGPSVPPEPPTDLWVDDEFWPLGTYGCPRPVFHWSGAAQATSYAVEVDEKEEPLGGYPEHYEGSTPFGWWQELDSETMLSGEYRFTVRAENNFGTASAVSEYFSVGGPPVAKTEPQRVQLEPVGSQLRLSADVTRNLYVYQAYVSANGTTVLNRRVDLDEEPEVVVDGRIELVLPGPAKSGTYTSWMRGYYAPWADHHTPYTVWAPGAPLVVKSPAAPVPLEPIGLVAGVRPAFSWNPVERIDRYRLYVTWNGKPYIDRYIALPDDFQEHEKDSTYAEVGAPMNWRDDYGAWPLALPFAFPFYDGVYTQLFVRTDGTLSFHEPTLDFAHPDLEENRFTVPTIVVYGDEMQSTEEAGCDIFTHSDATSCTIRWVTRQRTTIHEEDDTMPRLMMEQLFDVLFEYLPDDIWDCQYSVTLYPDGRLWFKYDPSIYFPSDIGVSAGDGVRRHIYDINESLVGQRNGPDLILTPKSTPGWTAHWDFPNGSYQWWVRAQRGTVATSPWARGGDFVIDEM